MSGRTSLSSAFRSLRLHGEAQSACLLRRPFSTTRNHAAPADNRGPKFDPQFESQLVGGSSKSAPARSGLATLSQTTRSQAAPSRDGRTTEEVLARVQTLIKDPIRNSTPSHHIHVYSHKRNTHITVTRPNYEPLLCLSCGNVGFRKGHRAGYEPAHQLSVYALGKLQEKGLLMEISRLEVVLRGNGPGREAFTKVILGKEGKMIRDRIVRVTDATRLKFGGTRSPQTRRLG